MGHLVVKDDEIPYVLDVIPGLAIELIDIGLSDPAGRKQAHQPNDSPLNQVDAGRLQRFDEAAGQTQGDAILVPVLPSLARSELDHARLGQRFTFDVFRKILLGVFVSQVPATIDKAVPYAML
jgi:hypothetical protein